MKRILQTTIGLLGFLLVACAPAVNPRDLSPVHAGETWTLEAHEGSKVFQGPIKLVPDGKFAESKVDANTLYTFEARSDERIATVSYSRDFGVLIVSVILELRQPAQSSTVVSCLFSLNQERAGYRGGAIFGTIGDLQNGALPSAFDNCTFTLDGSAPTALVARPLRRASAALARKIGLPLEQLARR